MPTDPRDYSLDVNGVTQAPQSIPRGTRADETRPYLSVLFNCCRVYRRVYRSPDGSTYVGKCPRCGLTVRFEVGEDGTDARQFVVE